MLNEPQNLFMETLSFNSELVMTIENMSQWEQYMQPVFDSKESVHSRIFIDNHNNCLHPDESILYASLYDYPIRVYSLISQTSI